MTLPANTVDAVDVAIKQNVAAAKQALTSVCAAAPEQWWTAFDLKMSARNGWSGSTMGLAFLELLEEGRIERGPDRRVRVRTTVS